MHKNWIGCAPQNFRASRPLGLRPEAIVIHIAEGSLVGTIAHFQNPDAGVSAHYLVARDGSVHQFVEETDTAFHAGIIVNPPKPLPRSGVNPNFYTIGIEHEGRAGDEWPEAMYAASAELVAEIAARWNIPLDEDHLLLHREIRASKSCPGPRFRREELLARAKAVKPPERGGLLPFVAGVQVLANTNVRQAAPSRSARIVRVLPANSAVTVVAFTNEGERVNGNSHWYQLADGNFFWAGTSSRPHPVPLAEPLPPVEVLAPPAPPATVSSGIPRIDHLLEGRAVPPLGEGDSDRAAVGALQDLLTGHGFTGLPGILSPLYGSFGSRTAAALRDFQQRQGIQTTGRGDTPTLQKLVTAPATDPRATQAYLTLVLRLAFTGMTRVLSLVSQMEGVGKFAALNLNTDRAGLSFGLIQWAQRPGRLPEILNAFLKADRETFAGIFGDGDPDLAAALIAHTRRPSGGLDPQTGQTLDPAFDLVSEPWITRFRRAALEPAFQRAQVQTALAAFHRSLARIRAFAPALKSERAVAFMLDVANQFGDAGAERLFKAATRPGLDEDAVLEAVADATVDHFEDRFKAGVRARRDMFLHTALLSGAEFAETRLAFEMVT
jgi:peptidoglycan hydrolase-like protein with peptidoglycan-binding domain